ncbi:MAG TPA: LysR substrate-binding domain-containing protein [Bdellovibrionales bacterium]|nr:LysR substrate-binding domain-containing protein [Bdellovibrionales bacterium]
MNVSWLTLRDLEYLTAVARHGHFGRAAEECNVSQPALSTQIKKLEDLLGTTLFERNKRRVAITAAGKRVVEQATRVLEEAEKIPALAKLSAEPLTDQFSLGAIATLGPYVFPKILKPLAKSFPKLQLRLQEGLTDGLLEGLKAGKLDAVLASRTFDETGFAVYPVFEEPLVVMLPKGHALAEKRPLRIGDLKAEDMVLLQDGHCLRDEALETCPANRRGNIRDFHATSLETLRYLVASGAGYTLMPVLAHDRPAQDLLTYRRIDGRDVTRTVVLVGRERSARKNDIEALAKWLQKEAAAPGSALAAQLRSAQKL